MSKLNPYDRDLLKKEGFKLFIFNKNPITMKLKIQSRKFCFLFSKFGKNSFPHLTKKPVMECVPNLNVFLKEWQAYFPFLY